MKWLKRAGTVILLMPLLLAAIFVLYEVFGMCVNHVAARRQTDRLQMALEREIPDIQILSSSSETGNLSGTGNHVDCVSSIIFSTGMQMAEIEAGLSEYYQFDGWSCFLDKTSDGYYRFYLNTSAPFADNIEGH